MFAPFRFRAKPCKFEKFVVTLHPQLKINALYMETLKKYLGVILLLLGVLCLILYKFAMPQNWLLICSMVLEVGGIFAFIFVNKALK